MRTLVFFIAVSLLSCEAASRHEAEAYAEGRRGIVESAIHVCRELCGDAGVHKMEIKSFDGQPICECK